MPCSRCGIIGIAARCTWCRAGGFCRRRMCCQWVPFDRKPTGTGMHWQHMRLPVDSIRPATNRDWQGLSFAEQRRFLRHLRPLWDTHSHRMAPQIGTVVHGSLRDGSLEVLAGRIRGLCLVQHGVEVIIAIRGRTEIKTLKVERVVNCTGPDTDLSRSTNPVLRNLVEQGWLQPDPQGLGALATI